MTTSNEAIPAEVKSLETIGNTLRGLGVVLALGAALAGLFGVDGTTVRNLILIGGAFWCFGLSTLYGTAKVRIEALEQRIRVMHLSHAEPVPPPGARSGTGPAARRPMGFVS